MVGESGGRMLILLGVGKARAGRTIVMTSPLAGVFGLDPGAGLVDPGM